MRWNHPPFSRWPHLAHHYRRIETLQREIIEAQQPSVDSRLPWQIYVLLVLLIFLVIVIMSFSGPAPLPYYW